MTKNTVVNQTLKLNSVGESPSQGDKFKQAAREHGADEDEARWEERLRELAKAKPEKPE
jgi:hypothetical protein